MQKESKNKKILFLPHCLRKSKICKAEITKEGYKCKECCKECKINILKNFAEDLNYKVIIAPGGILVKKSIQKYKAKVIIGIACKKEIELALKYLEKYKGTIDYIELSKDGCIDTDVDLKSAYKVLKKY